MQYKIVYTFIAQFLIQYCRERSLIGLITITVLFLNFGPFVREYMTLRACIFQLKILS